MFGENMRTHWTRLIIEQYAPGNATRMLLLHVASWVDASGAIALDDNAIKDIAQQLNTSTGGVNHRLYQAQERQWLTAIEQQDDLLTGRINFPPMD